MAGDRTSSVNARGHTTRYSYDADNHLTGIAYADGTSVSYGYNADGLRTLMVDGTGTTTYSYDPDKRVTSIAQPNGTVSYSYDANGNRTSLSVPGGTTTGYGYDAAGRTGLLLRNAIPGGKVAARGARTKGRFPRWKRDFNPF